MPKSGNRKPTINQPATRTVVVEERHARRPASGPKPTRSTGRNDYLATLLDPAEVKGVGIPDFDSRRAFAMHTRSRYVVRTRPSITKDIIIAVRPNPDDGLINFGYDPTAQAGKPNVSTWHCMLAGSVDLPATSSAATTADVVNGPDKALMYADFESFRPVSMGVRFVPEQAPLNASGLVHCIANVPANGVVFGPDSAGLSAGDYYGGISVEIYPSLSQDAPMFNRLDQIAAVADHSSPVLREFSAVWTPETPNDFEYLPVGSTAVALQTSGYVRTEYINTVTGNLNVYALSRHYVQSTEMNGAGGFTVDFGSHPYPAILFAFEGASDFDLVLGELVFDINWEMIPRPGLTALLPTHSQPANPLDLAQASNVMQLVPKVFDPADTSAPASAAMSAARASTSDLYTPSIPTKSALEGTSFWSRLKGGVSKISRYAAPFLAGVPKIGPLLSVGAGLLSSVLGR